MVSSRQWQLGVRVGSGGLEVEAAAVTAEMLTTAAVVVILVAVVVVVAAVLERGTVRHGEKRRLVNPRHDERNTRMVACARKHPCVLWQQAGMRAVTTTTTVVGTRL